MDEPPPSISPSSPYAALVNVASFVPTKLHWLSESQTPNYDEWREQMLCLITSQGLMQYIDGSITPPLGADQDYGVWERTNALVRGWILGSLDDNIVSAFVGCCPNAYQVWKALEKRFGQKFGEPEPEPETEHLKGKTVNESTMLHKALQEGDWHTVDAIFRRDMKAATDWIDGNEHTRPLHTAVAAGRVADRVVRNLMQLLDNKDLLSLRDAHRSTALHTAAAVGNITAAKLLVQKEQKLCYTVNKYDNCPIHAAALYVQREALEYLIHVTQPTERELNPYDGLGGQKLLTYLIQAEFFDVAINLAHDHRYMLQITSPDQGSPLTILTVKLKNASHLDYWQRIVCNYLQLDFLLMVQKCIEFLVPRIKESMLKMKKYEQALQLLEQMCKEIGSQEFDLAKEIFHEAVFVAAELGVKEVVEVIIKTFPGVVFSKRKPSGQHILHEAIENRSLDVFNLIYKKSTDEKNYFTAYFSDNYGNTPLHAAAKLAPAHKLNETSGAALQLQSEMQWFKEVEDIVHPYSREETNTNNKTPRMVFTEEHRLLKEAGEKWMKETTNSLTLVTALIATVMFTGAITVPGGNDEKTGYPIFSTKRAFDIFAVSDAVSLFTSITSLLLFLAILTSRYAEEDFLYSLPTKLIWGLAMLFLSIISMMVCSIATLYLVFGLKREWVIFPLLLFACMPVASFSLCQFPLLYVLIRSTYGRRNFYKKTTIG